MLDIIKSSYFHQILFSFMDICTKLKIFQHNKKWQNNLQFTLIDYKRYSGKYSIYEGKDQIKIYNAYRNRTELLYEGGFSNGKKNGKGKEYDNEGFKSVVQNVSAHAPVRELSAEKTKVTTL